MSEKKYVFRLLTCFLIQKLKKIFSFAKKKLDFVLPAEYIDFWTTLSGWEVLKRQAPKGQFSRRER
jgi:hypothetical protein